MDIARSFLDGCALSGLHSLRSSTAPTVWRLRRSNSCDPATLQLSYRAFENRKVGQGCGLAPISRFLENSQCPKYNGPAILIGKAERPLSPRLCRLAGWPPA